MPHISLEYSANLEQRADIKALCEHLRAQAATIDALFDQGPDVYIRGTKMPVQRITRPGDRADLIEYLSHFSETKENLQ